MVYWPRLTKAESNWERMMTKLQLIARVTAQIQLPKKQTEAIVNVFFTSIIDALSRGDKVELRGFGSFRVRQRSARTGRNPKTGEAVRVPAKRIPFFKASKDLQARVDQQ